jgi:hypothetical protein
MNRNNMNEERDTVLYAFHRECERPTVEQILDWVRRYPEFAEDIRAHAAVSYDWVAAGNTAHLEATQALLDRGYSNALNALYNAQAKAEASARAQSFHDIAAARNTDVVRVAREIDIARSVIADLFNGWMLAPIRKRLVEAVCKVLAIPRDAFDVALMIALQNPRFGHAKASQSPTIKARSCDDIIQDSNMPPERQRYWLEED